MKRIFFFSSSWRKLVLFTLCCALSVVVFSEIALYQLLQHPAWNRKFPYFKNAVAYLYKQHEAEYIQYHPHCGTYDSLLFYRMKPGECFSNTNEFFCAYSFNSAGLRDDEASLRQPEIIVMGDSYTLGWGIENQHIYASLIEKNTGKKTLNVSVASYGTARQFLLMKQTDRSNLKYLIIQYCTNDFEENKKYVESDFHLPVQPKETYDNIVRNHWNKKYLPMMYVRSLVKAWLQKNNATIASMNENGNKVSQAALASGKVNSPRDATPATANDSALYFLKIIQHHLKDENVSIIAFALTTHGNNTASFLNAVSSLKKDESFASNIRNMRVIDVMPFLNEDDFFILDEHLNENGHRKVAERVLAFF